jgi:hypothetical protein
MKPAVFPHTHLSSSLWFARCSSHQLQLWDGSYNPSASSNARDAAFAAPLRVRPESEERTLPPTFHPHHPKGEEEEDEGEKENDEAEDDGSEGGETTESEESGSRSDGGRSERSDDSEKNEREDEDEGDDQERERQRRKKERDTIKTQVIMARRKRRIISRSTPTSTVTSPRHQNEGFHFPK